MSAVRWVVIVDEARVYDVADAVSGVSAARVALDLHLKHQRAAGAEIDNVYTLQVVDRADSDTALLHEARDFDDGWQIDVLSGYVPSVLEKRLLTVHLAKAGAPQ